MPSILSITHERIEGKRKLSFLVEKQIGTNHYLNYKHFLSKKHPEPVGKLFHKTLITHLLC